MQIPLIFNHAFVAVVFQHKQEHVEGHSQVNIFDETKLPVKTIRTGVQFRTSSLNWLNQFFIIFSGQQVDSSFHFRY